MVDSNFLLVQIFRWLVKLRLHQLTQTLNELMFYLIISMMLCLSLLGSNMIIVLPREPQLTKQKHLSNSQINFMWLSVLISFDSVLIQFTD